MLARKIDLFGHKVDIWGVENDQYFLDLNSTLSTSNKFLINIISRLPYSAVVFDIGANVGLTMAIFSLRVSTGAVYAFEPSPTVFPCLKATIETNKFRNCRAYNTAMGEISGEMGFSNNSSTASASHLSRENSLGENNTIVTVSTIDLMALELEISRLDLIKIDVEGFELDVINGALKTIESLKTSVFVEFNCFTLIAFGNINPRQLLEKLLDTFPYVYAWDGVSPSLIGDTHASLRLIHNNIVVNGCVDDLYCTFSPLQ